MTTRRVFLLGGAALPTRFLLGPFAADATGRSLGADLVKIEQDSGGRLGVAILDTSTHAAFAHRPDERFPMCSTFKLLACAAVLNRVQQGREQLERRVRFPAGDIVEFSPVTKDRVDGSGMSIAELCAAAMTQSDNTAANLILASLGGPAAVTAYARSIGDTVSRLDRIEPALNEAAPGDARDTTTPAAMLNDLQALLLGDALSAASKDRLNAWLLGNKTGGKRLRAGLPGDWRIGDKTGSGDHGTANDIGVIWPPRRGPILAAIYLTEASVDGDGRNAAIAAVGRLIASWSP